MSTFALLGKDLREHGAAAGGLLAASVALTGLALVQNRAAAYSMSPFEVVRFALLTVLPLVTLVLGNRLVAREYLSRTRLFVEALPVGRLWPLALKWLLGFAFLALVAAAVLGLCALAANRVVDDPTPRWLGLLYAKSLVAVALYWSIAFCFGLCGHLRVMLYARCCWRSCGSSRAGPPSTRRASPPTCCWTRSCSRSSATWCRGPRWPGRSASPPRSRSRASSSRGSAAARWPSAWRARRAGATT